MAHVWANGKGLAIHRIQIVSHNIRPARIARATHQGNQGLAAPAPINSQDKVLDAPATVSSSQGQTRLTTD
jgi:hypothetical protein